MPPTTADTLEELLGMARSLEPKSGADYDSSAV